MGDRTEFPAAGRPAARTGGRAEAVAQVTGSTVSLDIPEFADEADASPALTAEWALWGKEEQRTGLHVLRCSKGTLTDDDFREIFTRYATGVKEQLPQYTVCWIPADGRRHPAYLAVGIHELADPGRADGRSQYVAGREVEYVRLFCFRYADVAEAGVGYADLARAVRREQLQPGQSEPVQVRLPSGGDAPAIADPGNALAPLVASMLLTTVPVCVLDADNVDADGRLSFIDEVLSLLPFGLRATLSASTWASPTAQDLKLRLFFSTARRDDGSRTCYVTWDQPGQASVPRGKSETAQFYRDWLKDASASALADLSRMTPPARFADDDISDLLATLPRDKSAADTFKDLSASLRAADQRAASAALRPLKHYLPRKGEPADLALYRSFVKKYELLAEYPGLNPNTMQALYRTLLRLAFGDEVSYADYRDIEEAAGWKPGWKLRSVLLQADTLTMLPCILVAKAGPGVREEDLTEALRSRGYSPGHLISVLDREIDNVQPRHRSALASFAMRYLCANGAEPAEELIRRGYLSRLFARACSDDQRRHELTAALRYVYGTGELNRRQIAEVFAQPELYADELTEEVVKSLTSRKLWWFVGREAVYARMTQAGQGADVAKLRQESRQRRARLAASGLRRTPAGAPRTIAMIPAKTVYAVMFLLGFVAVLVVVYAILRGSGG